MKYKKKKIKKYPTEWNLKMLFIDTPTTIKKERERVKKAYYKFINKWKSRKDYLVNPKILKKALDELEVIETEFSPSELYYLSLRSEKESGNPEIKAKINQARNFYLPIFNNTKFFSINISKIPKKNQSRFLNSKDLKDYRHFLEEHFENAKYTLTEPEEKILTLKNSVSHSNWVKMTSSFIVKEEREVLDEKGKKKIMTVTQIPNLYRSKDSKIRKKAADTMYDILEKHSDTAESEMNSILQNKKISDDLRGYSRPDSARHLSDDIDTKVIDLLINRISKRFKISRDFYNFRAKIAKVKNPKYHDRIISIKSGKPRKYSFDRAVKIVNEALSKLDREFGEIFMEFAEQGHIDVYPKKGKWGGAFCSSGEKKEPVYIFLNYSGELEDIMTIAHEVGHGINNVLKKRREKSLNSDTSLAMAEIASTFMEDFTLEEASKNLDSKAKFELLMSKLDDDMATIFRQIAAYQFEQELHDEFIKKGYLPKDEIGKIFKKHMADYLGNNYVDEKSSYGWVWWPHFRRFFYVYSYASGLLISKYFQAQVRKDSNFIEKVKKFLSTGSSKSPKDILKEIGVDITKPKIWDEGLREIENNLKEAKRLAKKLGRI